MRCANCNKIVGAHDLKEGLCSECYSPENVAKLKKGKISSYSEDLVELRLGSKTKRLGYKFSIVDMFTIHSVFHAFGEGNVKGILLMVFGAVLGIGVYKGLLMSGVVPSVGAFVAAVIVMSLVIGVNYPKLRIENLLKKGYEPADEHSKKVLKKLGFLSNEE